MLITDIIAKKRDKKELTAKEIEFFVKGATDYTIPDYQLSALLMAICLNGMTEDETVSLTLSMAKSGDMLDLSELGDKTADKHSTGGVGDKTTLICAPIAASLGCRVAKMSGRGLGHTGGTVDKLEAISGFCTTLTQKEFIENTKSHGICIVGQSGNFAPADKRLYALRDVTSTVESIPLIASSIMSKKIAAGAKNIVLDVKYGSGAFMKTPESAEKLARAMVKIGNSIGRKTTALITDMDIPLGSAVGNALEVEEACEILKGKGDNRLRELCILLAASMYSTSFNISLDKAIAAAEASLTKGAAFEKLCEMVTAQNGDTALITGEKPFPKAEATELVLAPKTGYLSSVDSFLIGKGASLSGAGRQTLEEKIDFSAGIVLLKQYGEYVKKDEPIAEIRGKRQRLSTAAECIKTAFSFSETKPPEKPLIHKIINEV